MPGFESQGHCYATFDMPPTQKLKSRERTHRQFTAEGFNAANRTNYATVNSIAGADFAPLFNIRGTAKLSPNQSLGFTAALPQREVQLGVRVEF